jgi:hypothetical protein
VRARRTGIALLLAAGLAGCGSSANNDHPGLTSGQMQGLVAQLRAVRATAATQDVEATKAAVARFRNSVTRLRRSGALSDPAARTLRIGAARVLARVESDNPAPTPPAAATQTTPAPAPVPPQPPGHKKKHEEKHGKGAKKHGDGGD